MTRICVTSAGTDLDSLVDPRFGRCAYFIVVDPDTMEFEAIQNEAANAAGGAGIRAAQTVVSNDVESVITGSVGPNALPALKDAGVSIFTGSFGTVRGAIEGHKKGDLQTIDQPGPAYRGMGYGLGRSIAGGGG
ncbi:MAG: NifB/NifX family molybdenum-iron cluster-binding protein [Candidatus Thorarchaeota archaeon]